MQSKDYNLSLKQAEFMRFVDCKQTSSAVKYLILSHAMWQVNAEQAVYEQQTWSERRKSKQIRFSYDNRLKKYTNLGNVLSEPEAYSFKKERSLSKEFGRREAQNYVRHSFKNSNVDIQSLDLLSRIPMRYLFANPTQDFIVKLLEDMTILIYHLTRSSNKLDVIVAITNFVKLRLNGPLFSVEHMAVVASKVSEFKDYFFTEVVPEVEEQSFESFLKSTKGYLAKYKEVRNAPIFKKLYKFYMYALTHSLLDKVGLSFDKLKYSKMEIALAKRDFAANPDMVHCLLDTIVFICEQGHQCFITGSLDPIYHCGSTYEEWFTTSSKLIHDSKFLGNPGPLGIDPFNFLADLSDTIEKGDAIYKHVIRITAEEKFESKMILKTLNDLKLIKSNETTKRSAMRERKAPFGVLIHGGSSVAKSCFTKMMFYQYANVFKLNKASEFMYTRNPFEEHWSSFQTSAWACRIDDVAFMHPNKCTDVDPSIKEIICMINNVAYVPKQADLPDKGKTPFKCKLVMASSNVADLNAVHYFSNPLAIRRRLPFVISISPKAQYAKHECMIDSSKLDQPVEGCFPDFWNIVVKHVNPVPAAAGRDNQRAQLVVVQRFTHVNDFLAWFARAAIDHESTQDLAMACDKTMMDVGICDECFRPLNDCQCDTESSGNEDNGPLVVQSGEWSERVSTRRQRLQRELYDRQCDEVRARLVGIRARLHDEANQSVEIAHMTMEDSYTAIDSINSMVDEELQKQQLLTEGETAWRQGLFSYIRYKVYCFTFYLFIEIYLYRGSSTWICRFPVFRAWFMTKVGIKIDETRMGRLLCKALGERVQRRIGKYSFLVSALVVISSSVLLYKAGKFIWTQFFPDNESLPEMDCWLAPDGGCACKSEFQTVGLHKENCMSVDGGCKCNLQPQFGEFLRGCAPKPMDDERVNVWYKNDFECTSFDVSDMSRSYKSFDMPIVQSRLSKNCLKMVFHDYEKTTDCGHLMRQSNAIAVGGHYILCNNHSVLSGDNIFLEIIQTNNAEGINGNMKFKLSECNVRRFPDKDIAFIEVRQLPPFKDIRNLFCEETLSGGFRGVYCIRDQLGAYSVRPVENIRRQVSPMSTLGELDCWRGYVSTPTSKGDCGSILLAQTDLGPIILGVHTLGGIEDPTLVYSIRVTRQDILKGLSLFDHPIVASNEPMLSSESKKRELGPINYKSPTCYIQDGIANIYGTFTGFRAKPKSHVEKTVICESMTKRGYQIKHGKPEMSSWMPWRLALLDMTKPVTRLDSAILKDAVDSFKRDIFSKLTKSDLEQVHVYDDVTAVNGAPGVAYVDKINRNTSAGAPWKKCKKFFLHPIDPIGELSDPVSVDSEIMDRVKIIIENYESGRRSMPVFCGNLKDEATTFKKIVAQKTRVFTGCPFDWQIVVRKYLLSTIRLIQNNRFVFESAPGTVAQSTEWQKIRKYLVAFGDDRMVAGDYAKFDKSMPPEIILAAFDILYAICKEAGYSEEELKVVAGVAEDTAFPLVDFQGDLIEFYGSNPSGHPLTVIINGLANSLYMRYCFASLSPDKTSEAFQRFVHLMTYGDDNVMGVSKEISWFNHTAIVGCLAKIGVTYTMADKEAESIPFINIKDVSFLKRTWRWDEDVGAYLCPLEHDSIAKMLTMCVRSKTITREQQAIAVISTALREYFFYGKDVFERKSLMLKEIVEENRLQVYVENSTFPTFDELKDSFWKHSN